MSNQKPLFLSVGSPSQPSETLSFPQKAGFEEVLEPSTDYPLVDAEIAPAPVLPLPVLPLPDALAGTDDAIAADGEAAPQPFWSPLGAESLQAYTWFGPWGPVGARFEVPGLTLVGSLGKDFLAATDQATTLHGLAGANLLLGGS
ncbi:MAG: hypothetical protein ICV62_14150, partial [Cyanobacteria bacterium Co-bin13]|nr:hypothetical protein [Cyanobacteria bacterium Co-bin13]